MKKARAAYKKIFVNDIPLLFETGGAKKLDAIVVVTAPASIQKTRVLSRPGMSVEKLAMIMARQVPDAEKRKRADYLVHTDKGLDFARREVQNIISDLLEGK